MCLGVPSFSYSSELGSVIQTQSNRIDAILDWLASELFAIQLA